MGPGWRDVLQGGAGVAAIVAGAPRGARALQQEAVAARVRAHVAESRAAREASGFGKWAARTSTPTDEPRRVVAFFDRQAVDDYYLGSKVGIGAPGRPFFVMPVEDANAVRNTADAARLTGMAPAAQRAYVSGGDVYGLEFTVPQSTMRVPTAADAGGWPHYLSGGHTAVRLPDPNGGFIVNSTREFVIPGGGAPSAGDVLFRLGPDGTHIPVRRF